MSVPFQSTQLAALLRKVRKSKGSIKTYTKAKRMLETFIFPKLGDKPIGDIRPPSCPSS